MIRRLWLIVALALAAPGTAGAVTLSASAPYAATDYVTGMPNTPTPFAGPTPLGNVGVVADEGGRLFVPNYASGELYRVAPPGGSFTSITDLAGAPSGAIAFGRDGRLYVLRQSTGEILEVSPFDGAIVKTVATGLGSGVGMATDPATGDLFVTTAAFQGLRRVNQVEEDAGPATVTGYGSGTPATSLDPKFAPDGTLFFTGDTDGDGSGDGVYRIDGTRAASPGAAVLVASVPGAQGLALQTDGAGHATAVFVGTGDVNGGDVVRVDLQTNAVDQVLSTDSQRLDLIGVGQDGCAYIPYGGVGSGDSGVIKLTDAGGGCSLTASTPPGLYCTDPAALLDTDNDGQITGTAGADTIVGTEGNETIAGGGGNDRVCARGGSDTVDGEGGADLLIGGGGDDTLLGGDGPDQLTGLGGADSLAGGSGDSSTDRLRGGLGADAFDPFDPDPGIDRVLYDEDYRRTEGITVNLDTAGADGGTPDGSADFVGTDVESVTGSAGPDTIIGSSENNTFSGRAGDDAFDGADGADFFSGGAGADQMEGGPGADRVTYRTVGAESGYTALSGGILTADVFVDLDGDFDDGVCTGTVSATGCSAGSEGDNVGSDVEYLFGGTGNDTLDGSGYGGELPPAGVSISGFSGDDRLVGTTGADALDGGDGTDALICGADALTDIFLNGETFPNNDCP